MAVSERQRIANIENAQQSTGPKTEAGKQASSMNSLRHGVFAKTVVMPGEDAEVYHALLTGLVDSLRPVGALEHVLVEKVAVAFWRSRRLSAWEVREEYANACRSGLPEPFAIRLDPKFQDRLARLQVAVDNATYKALRALREAQEWRLKSLEGEAATLEG